MLGSVPLSASNHPTTNGEQASPKIPRAVSAEPALQNERNAKVVMATVPTAAARVSTSTAVSILEPL